MNKIIAFSGSNSSASINQSLIRATAKMNQLIEVIDIREYDAPVYGMDLEKEKGIPQTISHLLEKLSTADAYIVATPEHNSLMPAFFKNILDWISRTGEKPFSGPTIILSTSQGGGGGAQAAAVIEKVLPYAGAEIVGIFSLPNFNDNFDRENEEILNPEKKAELDELIQKLMTALSEESVP